MIFITMAFCFLIVRSRCVVNYETIFYKKILILHRLGVDVPVVKGHCFTKMFLFHINYKYYIFHIVNVIISSEYPISIIS